MRYNAWSLLIEIFGLVTYVVSTAMTMILVWYVELVNALLHAHVLSVPDKVGTH